MDEATPADGHWPADPQYTQPMDKARLWVDGCFDFAHHGHAGAMLQARQQGTSLYVGVHSDESILHNKGPTVMTLAERTMAVEACRWTTKAVPKAPYVTQIPWIDHYGCWYVVHGDDITSDAAGEDCYRFVKDAHRFLVVKRTPGISTTDLVGRMLLCTKTHFVPGIERSLREDADMMTRIQQYATDETGLKPGSMVMIWHRTADPVDYDLTTCVHGKMPKPGQRVVYVDGGFDLFSSGHIEFLRLVDEQEKGQAYIVAGVHTDQEVNEHKGSNYPIMNMFERGLCVLQCKYVHALIFNVPFSPRNHVLDRISDKLGQVRAVYHGPTSFMPGEEDPYLDARTKGLFCEIPDHPYKNVNAREIVARIMKGREAFEERQRRKGQKAVGEEEQRRRELEAAVKSR